MTTQSRALSYKEWMSLMMASTDGRVIALYDKAVKRLHRDGFVEEIGGRYYMTNKGRLAIRQQGSSGGRA